MNITTSNRQSLLLEVLDEVCKIRPNRFCPEYCRSYHDMESGNFYHHILDAIGTWVCNSDYYWWSYMSECFHPLNDATDFPLTLQQYYGTQFPLVLEPWAESFMRERGVVDIDDVLLLRKFSATEAQALMQELVTVADETGAYPFKPYVYRR